MRRYLVISFIIGLLFFSSCHIAEHVKEAQKRTSAEKQTQQKSITKQERIKIETEPSKTQKQDAQAKNTTQALNSPTKQDTNNTSKTEVSLYKNYEKKWEINLTGKEDLNLLEEMNAWYGTPYKYGGKTKEGTDCSGMTIGIYKAVYDIDLTRSSYDMWKQSEAVEIEDLKDGDLVFFKINYVSISHVGIYISNGNFIHSSTSKGVIISNLEEDYYKKRFCIGGRINK